MVVASSLVMNAVILQCIDAPGWATERHPACKSSATTTPNSLLLETGLTWSNVTRSNFDKMGRLNKN